MPDPKRANTVTGNVAIMWLYVLKLIHTQNVGGDQVYMVLGFEL